MVTATTTLPLSASPARPSRVGASAPPSMLPRADAPAVNPWVVALTVTLATFMELLDTSIANVSLPHIAGNLGASLDESTWVLSSYLVANAVVLPLSAWLSRLFGRKRYYMFSVATFTIASALCGLAPSLGWLVVFRVLQGIGGGGLAPVEQAILVDTFPAAKRAAAFAVYSIAIVTAPAIGPTAGGWITDSWSWRWVFFINVPIGLLSLFLTSLFVHDPAAFTETRNGFGPARASARAPLGRVDWPGVALVAVAFGCLQVVLDKGQREDWFESRFIVAFALASGVGFVLGVWRELTTEDPAVDLSLLRDRNFVLASGLYFGVFAILFASTLLVPQMLEGLYGYTATDAGVTLSPGALVIVALVPLVVTLTRRVQTKWLMTLGLAIVALASWQMALVDPASDYAAFVTRRMTLGLGLAFLFVPMNLTAYSNLAPEQNNRASSLTNLFRNLGGSVGIALATTVLARRAQAHQSRLVEHVSAFDPLRQSGIAAIARTLRHAGAAPLDAVARAHGLVARAVEGQATLLAFLDGFAVLAALALVMVPLALAVKSFRPAANAGGH